MNALSFNDPNILATDTYGVNGYTVTAPIFTTAGARDIIDSTTRHAEKYFSANNSTLDAIGKTFAAWSDPDYALRQKALPIFVKATQFSAPNIVCFGLTPLKNVRFEADQLRELPQRLGQLIETGRYNNFSSWGNGYLKGYGTPKVTLYDRPRKVLQILAGNVVGPTWLSACLGAVLQCPQFIKLPYRDVASFMFYLQSLNDIAPEFRATIASGYYSSDDDVNDILLKETDVVIAMGSDETMNAIRTKLSRLNPKSRLIPH